MFRWLGWLVIAGLATTARAAPPASPGPPSPATRTHPLPPQAAAVTKHKMVATATRRAESAGVDPASVRAMTDDPVVGKAERVDGDEVKGVVAFTFDDGPNPETTPAVIDALEKYDIPATFFIVTQRIEGKHGEKSREILQRALDAGFLVGSHSVTHRSLRRAVGDKLTREVDASVKALAIQTRRPIGMFRAPYGALSPAGRVRLRKLGLTEVLWSVDTLDWKAHDPDRLRRKVLSMIKKDGGGIVLMHDVKPITAQVIADVLDDLEAENCARLADHREPILPVSLHYFLRDHRTARALPDAVKLRTAAYKAGLADRCAKRPPPPTPEPTTQASAEPTTQAAKPAAAEPIMQAAKRPSPAAAKLGPRPASPASADPARHAAPRAKPH